MAVHVLSRSLCNLHTRCKIRQKEKQISKRNAPSCTNEGAVISASFFYFQFVALYDEINSVSFLFPAVVALYDHIIKVSLAPSLYTVFDQKSIPPWGVPSPGGAFAFLHSTFHLLQLLRQIAHGGFER